MNLLDAIGSLWVGVGPAAGIVLGWALSRRSERAAWAREDRYRNRAEKVAAYSDFLARMEGKIERLIGDMNLAQVQTERDESEGPPDPAVPLQTILILAPEVAASAQAFFDYSVMFGVNVIRQRWKDTLSPDEDVPDFDADEYHRLRSDVIAAMRADVA